MNGNVLRVGGLAGILAGVFVVVGLIVFAAFPPAASPEEQLANFADNQVTSAVTIDLFLVAFLLALVFLGGLYWSLREPSRFFARIGLGSGVLSLILPLVALQGLLVAAAAFAGMYADAAAADRPVVVAAYGAVVTLLGAGNTSGFLLTGLALVAFGFAMRGSPDFSEGLAWLSIILGIVVVLFTFLVFAPVAIIAIAVFLLVVGWKVYSLAGAT
ncbi:MAG: hypothetical protein ACE5I4_08430 [Thermoplasmata archaeon]